MFSYADTYLDICSTRRDVEIETGVMEFLACFCSSLMQRQIWTFFFLSLFPGSLNMREQYLWQCNHQRFEFDRFLQDAYILSMTRPVRAVPLHRPPTCTLYSIRLLSRDCIAMEIRAYVNPDSP